MNGVPILSRSLAAHARAPATISEASVPALSAAKNDFRAGALGLAPSRFGYAFQNSSNSSPTFGRVAGATAQESFFSDSVLCICSVSGGVSLGVSETFRSAFRKRFTRSVETSDLYCLAFQLCGAAVPTSSMSTRPRATSSATMALARSMVIRSLNATAAIAGSLPPFWDVMQHRLNQARCCLSVRRHSLGSSTASSYARHHRLTPPSPPPCRISWFRCPMWSSPAATGGRTARGTARPPAARCVHGCNRACGSAGVWAR